jgi:hypothetical protein
VSGDGGGDLDKLVQTLQVLTMARLEAMGRRFAGQPRTGA